MKKKIAIMLGEFLTNFMKVIIHLPGFQVTITNEVYQSIMKELHGSRIEIEKRFGRHTNRYMKLQIYFLNWRIL